MALSRFLSIASLFGTIRSRFQEFDHGRIHGHRLFYRFLIRDQFSVHDEKGLFSLVFRVGFIFDWQDIQYEEAFILDRVGNCLQATGSGMIYDIAVIPHIGKASVMVFYKVSISTGYYRPVFKDVDASYGGEVIKAESGAVGGIFGGSFDIGYRLCIGRHGFSFIL
jgi:hypothetical protein